ncbi:MAG: ribonuclease HI family protein, partial [Bdellovibrionales bacterium]|nr:ribonuclease HI family protein [Bdellovibrionales bacterium]
MPSYIIENGEKGRWPEELIIHTDGACRGNPGPSSIGIVFSRLDLETVYEYAETIGSQTNNFAEYFAVKKAFEIALSQQVLSVHLKSDSQLLIRQLTGEYKVKSEGLMPLYLDCRSLVQKFKRVQFEHVRRE